jgi:hypothetical protein
MSLTSLAATFGISASATMSKTEEMSTLTDVLSKIMNQTFALGTGANQVNGLFHDTRTLADGANETLNFLAAGSLEDKLGEAMDLDILKAFVVKNNSADASLIVGATGAGQMPIFGATTERVILPPGGVMVVTAPDVNGIDVSSAASMKFEHDGTGVDTLDYDLIVAGVQS